MWRNLKNVRVEGLGSLPYMFVGVTRDDRIEFGSFANSYAPFFSYTPDWDTSEGGSYDVQGIVASSDKQFVGLRGTVFDFSKNTVLIVDNDLVNNFDGFAQPQLSSIYTDTSGTYAVWDKYRGFGQRKGNGAIRLNDYHVYPAGLSYSNHFYPFHHLSGNLFAPWLNTSGEVEYYDSGVVVSFDRGTGVTSFVSDFNVPYDGAWGRLMRAMDIPTKDIWVMTSNTNFDSANLSRYNPFNGTSVQYGVVDNWGQMKNLAYVVGRRYFFASYTDYSGDVPLSYLEMYDILTRQLVYRITLGSDPSGRGDVVSYSQQYIITQGATIRETMTGNVVTSLHSRYKNMAFIP